jgi:hypothetical protein
MLQFLHVGEDGSTEANPVAGYGRSAGAQCILAALSRHCCDGEYQEYDELCKADRFVDCRGVDLECGGSCKVITEWMTGGGC